MRLPVHICCNSPFLKLILAALLLLGELSRQCPINKAPYGFLVAHYETTQNKSAEMRFRKGISNCRQDGAIFGSEAYDSGSEQQIPA